MTNTPDAFSSPRTQQVPRLGKGERVYVAAPKSEYASSRYQHLVVITQDLFPDAVIIEARTAFLNAADWRAKWPEVAASLSALVFFTTPDGWVGRGVWAEIQEARKRVPVYLLSDGGQLVPYDALTSSLPDPSNWTRHVRVGEPPGGSYA